MPMLTNLRMDPIERAFDEATEWTEWSGNRLWAFAPAVEYVAQWMSSFKEFPPRSKLGTYGLSQVMEAMIAPPAGKR